MKESKLTTINILANSIAGPMSGGDRIWIECAKRWAKKSGIKMNVFTTEEGIERAKRYGLSNVNYVVLPSLRFRKFGVYVVYILRTIKGVITAMKSKPSEGNVIIFSSSDFVPDSIPAWIMKMRFKSLKWIAAFYLFAPNPLSKESPYRGIKLLRGLLYWLAQIPTYCLIKKYADMVFVTNELDGEKFIDKRLTPNRVIVVRGGVDTKTPVLVPEPKEKKYDAVFIGRFHPQKGVLELMDIWKYFCTEKLDARLAMIGTGELESKVKEKIKTYGLEDNMVLFGFKDGVEKLRIFKDSRVVVHPAIYDSGGMAACEAMACGLPGVSFDLPALRTYYPKGMLKTPCFDLEAFAENIMRLLADEKLYEKTAKNALDWAREWDWDKRAEVLMKAIKSV